MAAKKNRRVRILDPIEEARTEAYEDGYHSGLADQADLEHKGILGLAIGALMGGALGYSIAAEPELVKQSVMPALEHVAKQFREDERAKVVAYLVARYEKAPKHNRLAAVLAHEIKKGAHRGPVPASDQASTPADTVDEHTARGTSAAVDAAEKVVIDGKTVKDRKSNGGRK